MIISPDETPILVLAGVAGMMLAWVLHLNFDDHVDVDVDVDVDLAVDVDDDDDDNEDADYYNPLESFIGY